MKKLLFLLALIMISTVSISQTIYKVTQITSGQYTTASGKWKYEAPVIPSAMKVVMHGNTIVVGDEANSSYRLQGEADERKTDTYSQASWTAYDEKNRRVYLSIRSTPSINTVTLHIMYDTKDGYYMYGYDIILY